MREVDDRAEFLYAYSDDLIYLNQALDALLFHPHVDIVPQWAVASIARHTAMTVSNIIEMTLVMMVGNERIGAGCARLHTYLKRATKHNLEEAVAALSWPGHEPDRNQLREAYLLRRFRNALVHTSWNDPSGTQEPGVRRAELSASFLATGSPRRSVDLAFLSIAHTHHVRRILAFVQALLLSAYLKKTVVLPTPLSARRFMGLFDVPEDLIVPLIKGHRGLHDHLDATCDATFAEQQRNLNFQPTLSVPAIRNLYLRNVSRFLSNVQAAYKPSELPPNEWPVSRVDQVEWLSVEARLAAAGFGDAGARAYEVMVRKAVLMSGGGLTSSHAAHAVCFRDAADSVNDWLIRHVRPESLPWLSGLDTFHRWDGAQLLALVRRGDSDDDLSEILEGVDTVGSGELPEMLGEGTMAQFVLLDGPVVQHVLKLPVLDLPKWSLPLFRLEALGYFIARGSTQLLENLVWLELAATILRLDESPAGRSGMVN